MSDRIIGYEQPSVWYCRVCVPKHLTDADGYEMRESIGFGYCCEICGKELAPCQHEWTSWTPMHGREGRESRDCMRPGCEEFEEREAVRS